MFRKIIKKLNNFRTTSIVMAIISGCAAFYALLVFFYYHFAGPGFTTGKFIKFDEFGKVIEGGNVGSYLGFVLFLAFVGTLITGIMVAYSCVPFIKNKEKLLPRKGLLITGFVGSIFELVLIVLTLILAVAEHPSIEIGIWEAFPLGVVSMIGTALYLVAFLKCDFYMPEIRKD